MIIIKLKEDKQLQILIFKIIYKIKIEDKLKIKILAQKIFKKTLNYLIKVKMTILIQKKLLLIIYKIKEDKLLQIIYEIKEDKLLLILNHNIRNIIKIEDKLKQCRVLQIILNKRVPNSL